MMDRYIDNILEIMKIKNLIFFKRIGVLLLLLNLFGIVKVVVKVIVVKSIVINFIVLV